MICNVDIGIGNRQRSAFLQRLAVLKNCLVPAPKILLVVGDGKNQRGGALDAASLGCSSHDLAAMVDGNLKRRLEDIACQTKELWNPSVLEAFSNIGTQETPSSLGNVLLVEALIILFSPSKVFHDHIPMSSVRGVTWAEARRILATPDKLVTALVGVDEHSIPPDNISTLQVGSHFVCFFFITRGQLQLYL